MDFSLTDQQRALVDAVDRGYERHFRRVLDRRDADLVARLRAAMAEHGMLGLNMPQAYGGQGLPLLDTLLVIQALQAKDSMLGALAHRSSTGAVGAILALGDEDLKRHFVTGVCEGRIGISIGITEPEAGSAATAMTTRARPDGEEVVLDGRKQYVSFVDHNHFTVVYCRFGTTGRPSDIGAVIVPHDAPGFSRSKGSLNMADELLFELYFDGCRVPRRNVLVDGGAFGKLISVYNAERLGSIARMLGSAQAAFEQAVEYTRMRRQFDREIADFQGVQWMLADMKVKLEAAQLLTYRAAANAGESGLPVPFETSLAKAYTAVAAKEICDDALQLHGANGYTREYPLVHRYAEVRGGSIYGGTVQIHKNMIASHILGRKNAQWKKPGE
jgi:alkylation response protein AidB-like acyl-CoA dehydrogenase